MAKRIKNTDLTKVPATELFEAIKQTLSEGYDVEFTVTGNSMWPILCDKRDRVIISACNAQEIKPGDTVLYCPIPEKYLLHRVTNMKDGKFRAAGDGNCFYDGTFSTDCIVAKVTVYTRKGKKYSADSFVMKLWSFGWRILFPVRKILLSILHKISGLKKRFNNHKN